MLTALEQLWPKSRCKDTFLLWKEIENERSSLMWYQRIRYNFRYSFALESTAFLEIGRRRRQVFSRHAMYVFAARPKANRRNKTKLTPQNSSGEAFPISARQAGNTGCGAHRSWSFQQNKNSSQLRGERKIFMLTCTQYFTTKLSNVSQLCSTCENAKTCMSASSQKPVDDGLPRTSLSFHTSLNTITEASSIALLNSLHRQKNTISFPFRKR